MMQAHRHCRGSRRTSGAAGAPARLAQLRPVPRRPHTQPAQQAGAQPARPSVRMAAAAVVEAVVTAEEAAARIPRGDTAGGSRGLQPRPAQPAPPPQAATGTEPGGPWQAQGCGQAASPASPAGAVMVVEDVTIQAGVRDLLSNVSWRLMPGHRVGLVGANGAGKSTLLKCLAGMRTVRTWAREPWGAAPQLARCPGGAGD